VPSATNPPTYGPQKLAGCVEFWEGSISERRKISIDQGLEKEGFQELLQCENQVYLWSPDRSTII
jgi:hypothetical protein